MKRVKIKCKHTCKHTYYGYGYETQTSIYGVRSNTVYNFKCSRCGKIKHVNTKGHDYILSPLKGV
jgi:hypothetical protein